MSKEATAPAAVPEPEVVEAVVEVGTKEAIYVLVGNFVKEKTGKRIGKTGGREIFDLVVDNIFAAATKAGSFRFNGGFGSLQIRTYGEGTRRLPSGQEVTFGERRKLRYEEGVVVEALVANGGNLEEAYKVRGSRAPEKEAAPAATAPAAAPVKAETCMAAPAGEAADLELD